MAFKDFAKKLARYNATLPTITDGDLADQLQVDVNGRLIITADQALPISATDLDIRDLSAAQDNVAISDGTDTLAINADGSINATINNASIAVTATDLDVRDLSAAQDNVAISDGTDTLAINADGSINVGNTVTVQATDLDIRDLSSATDSVAIGGDALTSLQLIDDLVHLEDAAHVSGDAGMMPLAVRNDVAGTLAGTDGDYAPLQVDADGNLRVTGSFNSSVDDVFESGTEADSGASVVALANGSMTTVESVAVGAGVTYYITGMDYSSDDNTQWELVVMDGAVVVETIRAGIVESGQDVAKEFNRAIEITGAATRTIQLRAQAFKANVDGAGGFNGYTR